MSILAQSNSCSWSLEALQDLYDVYQKHSSFYTDEFSDTVKKISKNAQEFLDKFETDYQAFLKELETDRNATGVNFNEEKYTSETFGNDLRTLIPITKTVGDDRIYFHGQISDNIIKDFIMEKITYINSLVSTITNYPTDINDYFIPIVKRLSFMADVYEDDVCNIDDIPL